MAIVKKPFMLDGKRYDVGETVETDKATLARLNEKGFIEPLIKKNKKVFIKKEEVKEDIEYNKPEELKEEE